MNAITDLTVVATGSSLIGLNEKITYYTFCVIICTYLLHFTRNSPLRRVISRLPIILFYQEVIHPVVKVLCLFISRVPQSLINI